MEEHIRELLEKYQQDTLTPQQYRELLEYFGKLEHEQISKQALYDALISEKIKHPVSDFQIRKVTDAAYNRIEGRMVKKRNLLLRKILPYAAAVLAIISMSIYAYQSLHRNASPEMVSTYGDEVLPGTNRATLIIEGGKAIPLSEGKTGIKVSKDQILYNDGTAVTEKHPVQYATLSTPRKGQYQINLPDGTKVWLNAESSLRYPTAFSGAQRLVELQGEGYFEVAHDAKHPFIVKSGHQSVKVLGTTFNINTYPNEPGTVTTLLSGRIELENETGTIRTILSPDQQAVLANATFHISTVDAQLFSAWKDGKFRFKGASIQQVLRQLERWYDIKVDYKDIPDRVKIYASIRRDKKLSSVLSALEEISGIKFKVEGRRLLLMD
ncbi:FecR family protein [Chryseobacterium angstadtii]|uniref:FecR family protein n=1 Tax=Chryseobacterium angstadtii TaxID=558151 RepID=UPI00065AE1B6|nr:FecR family protein [Chryseobacterium angstadtii]